MTDLRLRRGLLFGSLGAMAILAFLGFVIWKALPPMTPPLVKTDAGAKPYPGPPVLPTVLARPQLTGITAALINEPENVRVTAAGHYANELVLWRAWATSLGVTFVAPEAADVLLVPEARCLGPIDRRRIQQHLQKGGGLVSTGAMGALDGVCAPLRDTLLVQMLGKQGGIKAAPRRGDESFYAIVMGETVLGADIPPAARIEMSPAGQIVFRNSARELIYTNYERVPLHTGDFFDAATARALVGNGRVVAFGFALQGFIDSWSNQIGHLVVANAIRWAAGRPTYQIAPWPNNKQAAAVVAQDVEADYHNATQALDAIAQYDLPGTAFIVGKLALKDAQTTARIKQDLEIGTHTHRHLPLDTLSPGELTKELEQSKRVAEQIAGRPVRGMRPPEERFTLQTLQIWADLGGDYVFGSTEGRAGAPEIIPMVPDSLIMLARISEDDFEILSRDQLRDRRLMSTLIGHQIGEVIAYRALYMFSYHSHLFSQKQLLPVLADLAQKLKASPTIWIATAGEVATWWRARFHLTREPAPSGEYVTLRNEGAAPFSGGILIIDRAGGQRQRVRLPVLQPGTVVQIDSLGRLRGTQSVEPMAAR